MSQPLSTLTEDSELVQILEQSEILTAEDLVTLCSSKEKISVEFCEGYLRWTTHFWKTSTACVSELPEEQSFCDGVDSARQNIDKALMGCPDCDDEALDEPEIEWHIPGVQHDRSFCASYNAELASMFASRPSLTASARSLGSDAADTDAFVQATLPLNKLWSLARSSPRAGPPTVLKFMRFARPAMKAPSRWTMSTMMRSQGATIAASPNRTGNQTHSSQYFT